VVYRELCPMNIGSRLSCLYIKTSSGVNFIGRHQAEESSEEEGEREVVILWYVVYIIAINNNNNSILKRGEREGGICV